MKGFMSKQASKGVRVPEKILTILTLVAMTTPTYAATNLENSKGSIDNHDDGESIGIDTIQGQSTSYFDEISMDETQNTKVYVTQTSTFSAIIPKTIILNGTNGEENSGNYEVKAKGNIAANEYVSITPSVDTFNMTQQGKKDIVATITQEKSLFKVSGVETTDEQEEKDICIYGINDDTFIATNGSVVASDMTAGKWYGNFNFNIALNKHQHRFESTLKVNPTCTTKGVMLYTCRCGVSFEDDEIEELGHNYKIEYINNGSQSLEKRTCIRCNDIQTAVACMHDMETSTSSATCGQYGAITYTCKKCGYSYKETLDKVPHMLKAKSDTEFYCTTCNKQFTSSEVYRYSYNGTYQTFTAPKDGIYYIAAYGAAGGADNSRGGYGGYVEAYTTLKAGTTLYIACGNVGESTKSAAAGGWNGGANAATSGSSGGGGGATVVYTSLRGDGQLKNYENNKNEVLIVAGGGAGGSLYSSGAGGSVLYQGDGTNYPGTISNGASTNLLNGNFAIGTCLSTKDGGGGGGGWVGGRNGLDAAGNSGGGGASFINTGVGMVQVGLTADNNQGVGRVVITYVPMED